jgi:hypothetical protein
MTGLVHVQLNNLLVVVIDNVVESIHDEFGQIVDI